MTMTHGLEHCPFCGSNTAPMVASSYTEHDEDRVHSECFAVVCSATTDATGQPARGCGAGSGWEDSREEAVAAWNQRVLGAITAAPQDDFKGNNEKLVSCINALLTIDTAGSLLPHGIGGHARALLAAAASRLAAATAAQPDTCRWTLGNGDDVWQTACGGSWVYEDGGPEDNAQDFCHRCGKPLEIVRETDASDDDAPPRDDSTADLFEAPAADATGAASHG